MAIVRSCVKRPWGKKDKINPADKAGVRSTNISLDSVKIRGKLDHSVNRLKMRNSLTVNKFHEN